MEFAKIGLSAVCFFAICLQVFLASNSRANPVDDTKDRGLEVGHRQKCPHPRGQFPHFRYCDWFYNCWDGAVFEQQCPKGLVFNPTCQYCDYPANVDCCGTVIYAHTPADSKCPAPDGVFPDPWDCSYFVLCAAGRGTRQVCPAGLLFNPKFYGCDYPQHVQCLQGTATTSNTGDSHNQDASHRCPNGYYPHTSCQRFWSCSSDSLALKFCPAGQQFDVSSGQCKDEQLVQCHASIGTGHARLTDLDETVNAQEIQE